MSRRRPWLELALAALLAALAGLAWWALLPGRSLVESVGTAAVVSTVLIAARAGRRPSVVVDLAVSAVAYVVVAGVMVYRPTTFAGLPTVSTLRAIGDGLAHGMARTLSTSVPAPPLPAIRLVPFTVAWVAGLWGALLTLRSRSALSPCLAAVAGFVLGGLLGGETTLVALAGALVATVVLYVVVRVAHRDGPVDSTAPAARGWWRPAVRLGLPLAIVVVAGSVTAGAAVGFQAAPFDLHDHSRAVVDPRSALSPLRQIQARVQQTPPVPLFDAAVDLPTGAAVPNFRQVVLDQFDGAQWSSSETFLTAAGDLGAEPATAAPTQQITSQVTIRELTGFWLPAVATPVGVTLPTVQVGQTSRSLAATDRSVAGLRYGVTSVVTRPTADQLRQAQPDTSDPSASALPDGAPADLAAIKAVALHLTAGETTPYGQLTALQRALLSAPYRLTTTAPAGESYARVVQFLGVDHNGTSEQFATAYAVLARALGFPSRVVAGFHHGPAKDGTFTITSADAYAWPEIDLAGLGWIPFDATPGLGQPAPAAPSSPDAITSPAEVGGSADPGAQSQGSTPEAAPPAAAGPGWVAIVAVSLAALLALGLIATPLVVLVVRSQRLRRLRRAPSVRDRVTGAWRHAVEPVRPPVGRGAATLTAAEVGALATLQFGDEAAGPLVGLGVLANRARFDSRSLTEDEAGGAWALADAFRAASRARLRRRERWWGAVDPRTLRRR